MRLSRIVFVESFFLLCMVVLSACQKNQPSDSSGPAVDQDHFKVNWTIQAKEEFADDNSDLIKAIVDKKDLSFQAITSRIVKKHLKAQNSALGDAAVNDETSKILIEIKSIMDKASSKNPAVIKSHYESAIEQNLGQELKYNLDAVNLVQPLREGRLQCYSGTILHLSMLRQLAPLDYRSLEPVVVFEPGHVLPGYMSKKNGSWTLFGIETTVSGYGAIDFGLAKNLSSETIVVGAENFVLYELIKDGIKNAEDLRNQLIAEAAEKYGIISNSLSNYKVRYAGTNSTKLNQTPFAFGEVKVSPGDQKREPSRGSAFYLPTFPQRSDASVKELELIPPAPAKPPSNGNGTAGSALSGSLLDFPIEFRQPIIHLNESGPIQWVIWLQEKHHVDLSRFTCPNSIFRTFSIDENAENILVYPEEVGRQKLDLNNLAPYVSFYIINPFSPHPLLLIRALRSNYYDNYGAIKTGVILPLCGSINETALPEPMSVREFVEHLGNSKSSRKKNPEVKQELLMKSIPSETHLIYETNPIPSAYSRAKTDFVSGVWGQWKRKISETQYEVVRNSFKCEPEKGNAWCIQGDFPKFRIEESKDETRETRYYFLFGESDVFVVGPEENFKLSEFMNGRPVVRNFPGVVLQAKVEQSSGAKYIVVEIKRPDSSTKVRYKSF